MPLPLLEAGLVIIWSSGFIGARFSIDYAPASLVVFWRCLLVTLILLPFVARQLRQTPPAVLLKNAGIGLLAMAGYLFGVTEGIALGVPAGLAALFADLLPIGMAVLAAVVLRQRLTRGVWIGLLIGLAGVMLATHDALAWGSAPPWAYALPVLGMLSLAVATLWQKHSPDPQALGLLPNLWLQCFVSTFVFAVVAGLHGSLAPVPRDYLDARRFDCFTKNSLPDPTSHSSNNDFHRSIPFFAHNTSKASHEAAFGSRPLKCLGLHRQQWRRTED
ncbi:DMT family transporter [Pseudomonas sp. W5-36]|uniref:DMT family transporter n=1 Tax=Pseudomonas sp. W5-36 TaxID=3097455 RepID=UPI00397CF4A8